jgi:hypothetical protein
MLIDTEWHGPNQVTYNAEKIEGENDIIKKKR